MSFQWESDNLVRHSLVASRYSKIDTPEEYRSCIYRARLARAQTFFLNTAFGYNLREDKRPQEVVSQNFHARMERDYWRRAVLFGGEMFHVLQCMRFSKERKPRDQFYLDLDKVSHARVDDILNCRDNVPMTELFAVKKIQRNWRIAIACPDYLVCRRRLECEVNHVLKTK